MPNHLLPEITFARFQTQFEDWEDDEFSSMIEEAALTAKSRSRGTLANDLKGLDFANPIDRWYATCSLLEHKAKLPDSRK